MIERNEIIQILKERLYPYPFAHAMWLEGADSNQMVDQYSDIDFWLDVDDESEEEAVRVVEQILEDISPIEYRYVMNHSHPKIRQRIYHIKGTNPYLMIDFCWQLHSRDPKECCFIRGSRIETPLILFDKSGVISFRDFDINEFHAANRERFNECRHLYTQHSRVVKYCYRGQYLEAYAYYNRYVLEPIVDMLRILYTPANAEYYLVHISNHIPEECVKRLEYFARISSIEDILYKTEEAKGWFDLLSMEAGKKYGYL